MQEHGLLRGTDIAAFTTAPPAGVPASGVSILLSDDSIAPRVVAVGALEGSHHLGPVLLLRPDSLAAWAAAGRVGADWGALAAEIARGDLGGVAVEAVFNVRTFAE
jgi:hypothetical protein